MRQVDRNDYSAAALCAQIFERYQDRIRVKKPGIAIANLARIIEATLEIANQRGFHSTSLRDLAEASGLSMGALYNYFDSKETLLMMILGQVVEAIDRLGAPPSELGEDPMRRLDWLLRSHVLLTDAMRPWFVFAFMEAKAFPRAGKDIAIESELATERMIADILRDGVERGVFQIDDVAMTAALVKPLLQDWYIKRGKYRRRGVGADAYADSIVAFMRQAVVAPAGRRRVPRADLASPGSGAAARKLTPARPSAPAGAADSI